MMLWKQLADSCFPFESYFVSQSTADFISIFWLVLIYRCFREVSCILKLLKVD